MAHTPGPWRPFAWGKKVGVTGDLNTADIALVSGFDTNRSLDEEMANARLIAAAPDLLDAVVATRKLVAEAALTGFNYADGNWAERLFANQAVLSAAIKEAEERL